MDVRNPAQDHRQDYLPVQKTTVIPEAVSHFQQARVNIFIHKKREDMPRLTLLMLIVVLALVVPPLLLLPMVLHMSYAQYFKDFYEASMWISPAIGMITILLMTRYLKQGQVSLRQVRPVIVLVGAVFDLLSPVYLYILLAVLAGH